MQPNNDMGTQLQNAQVSENTQNQQSSNFENQQPIDGEVQALSITSDHYQNMLTEGEEVSVLGKIYKSQEKQRKEFEKDAEIYFKDPSSLHSVATPPQQKAKIQDYIRKKMTKQDLTREITPQMQAKINSYVKRLMHRQEMKEQQIKNESEKWSESQHVDWKERDDLVEVLKQLENVLEEFENDVPAEAIQDISKKEQKVNKIVNQKRQQNNQLFDLIFDIYSQQANSPQNQSPQSTKCHQLIKKIHTINSYKQLTQQQRQQIGIQPSTQKLYKVGTFLQVTVLELNKQGIDLGLVFEKDLAQVGVLVLINLSIGDEGLQYLCRNSGKACNVRKLLLDYNLFKNVDERMIDELRKNMPELRYVSLVKTTLTPKSNRTLLYYVANPSNSSTQKPFKVIFQDLRLQRSLSRENQNEDQPFRYDIFESLRLNNCFDHTRILDLDNNNIGNYGMITIAKLVGQRRFPRLQKIELDNNGITKIQAQSLLSLDNFVKSRPVIQRFQIDLYNNPLTDGCIFQINKFYQQDGKDSLLCLKSERIFKENYEVRIARIEISEKVKKVIQIAKDAYRNKQGHQSQKVVGLGLCNEMKLLWQLIQVNFRRDLERENLGFCQIMKIFNQAKKQLNNDLEIRQKVKITELLEMVEYRAKFQHLLKQSISWQIDYFQHIKADIDRIRDDLSMSTEKQGQTIYHWLVELTKDNRNTLKQRYLKYILFEVIQRKLQGYFDKYNWSIIHQDHQTLQNLNKNFVAYQNLVSYINSEALKVEAQDQIQIIIQKDLGLVKFTSNTTSLKRQLSEQMQMNKNPQTVSQRTNKTQTKATSNPQPGSFMQQSQLIVKKSQENREEGVINDSKKSGSKSEIQGNISKHENREVIERLIELTEISIYHSFIKENEESKEDQSNKEND